MAKTNIFTLKKDTKVMFLFTQKRFFLFVLIVGMFLIFLKPVYAAEPCQIVPTSQISSIDQAKCLFSTPNLGNDTFPNNINEASWEFNNFNKYGSGDNSPAHIIINRVGQSVTRKDFNTPWRSTRRESEQFCGVNKCKGLFLAVELVQPRKCQPNSGQTQCSPPRKNDAKSPDTGFTKAQLDRLAVVYIAASVRRGKWLIPAFHVVLDQIVPGGHDDPQNFNLDQWSKQLNDILTEIRS